MGNDGGGDHGWLCVVTGDDEDDEEIDVERQYDILLALVSSEGTLHFARYST
jgi:hypothetical protein